MAIRFEGEFTVPTSRDEVYALLADPRRFAPLLPTYKSLEVRDERTTDVTVQVGVGKVRGSAVVTLALQGEDPPLRAAYSGKGKVIGSAFDMVTSFDLHEVEGGGTCVKWAGDLTMFGKLVALAGGLIRPLARKDITRLVGAIQAALTPGGVAVAGAVSAESIGEAEVAPEGEALPGAELAPGAEVAAGGAAPDREAKPPAEPACDACCGGATADRVSNGAASAAGGVGAARSSS